jgi:hypothetical protein
VINEDVYCSKELKRFLAGQTRPLDRAQVGFDAEATASFAFHQPPRGIEAGGIPAGKNEVGTGIGEDGGDFSAKPAGSAGDERASWQA